MSSVRQAASTWRRAVGQAAAAASSLGDRLLEIRYEDLHDDPRVTYRRLFEFGGMPYDDELLGRVERATDFGANFQPNEAGFRRGGRVGDWRTRFTAADCLAFQLEAGSLLVELGYESDDRWVERLAPAAEGEAVPGAGP